MCSGDLIHYTPLPSTFNHLPQCRSIKKNAYLHRFRSPSRLLPRMRLFVLRSTIGCALLVCAAKSAFGQSPDTTENNANRVTVSMKADGSRTVYKFDDAQHKAVATTTDQEGKLREKIHYDIDEAG